MDTYFLAKTLHILSATVLFGTGLGTAFFMFRSHACKDVRSRYEFARTTVLADYLFTTPAVIIQPVTGVWLISQQGYDPLELWLLASYGLFVLAGLCWLPVVWIQIRLKKMLRTALDRGEDLPDGYNRLFGIWFALGWPAFGALIVVFWLMVSKPTW